MYLACRRGALYRSGRQAEALEAYQQTRHSLVEVLGIEPGRPLRELEQAILRQDLSLEVVRERHPEADAEKAAFVGRGSELEKLRAGLSDAIAGRGGLFLLVGEPGIGKSRLADEVMRETRERGVGVLVGPCWEAGGAPQDSSPEPRCHHWPHRCACSSRSMAATSSPGPAGAQPFWAWLASHPATTKRLEVVRSGPSLTATHAAPKLATPGAREAFWKPLDRLIAESRRSAPKGRRTRQAADHGTVPG